ncbi:hypothetical protein Catovirus_1_967 [Catovirus CTV1]|uniref:Uncharacterized protein n=1 Tax=Catovirus CTV1 TaxID=1977631 RepID=A0A1V0SB28_9VIRU|nr:hypothetical protein Catovirus_1_967 [Catovirus CTV1]
MNNSNKYSVKSTESGQISMNNWLNNKERQIKCSNILNNLNIKSPEKCVRYYGYSGYGCGGGNGNSACFSGSNGSSSGTYTSTGVSTPF